MSPAQRGILASIGAMCLQGAWGAYANHRFGPWIAGRAAMVQGVCSFGMTYAVTRLIEWLAMKFQTNRQTPRAAKTIVLAIAWMIGVQTLAHWLGGTPHIAITIAPAATLGSIYCTVYTIGRVAADKRRVVAGEAGKTVTEAVAANSTAVRH